MEPGCLSSSFHEDMSDASLVEGRIYDLLPAEAKLRKLVF